MDSTNKIIMTDRIKHIINIKYLSTILGIFNLLLIVSLIHELMQFF
jgi:hypothetical protein